jgi:hypothetical protein
MGLITATPAVTTAIVIVLGLCVVAILLMLFHVSRFTWMTNVRKDHATGVPWITFLPARRIPIGLQRQNQ